MQQEGEKTVQKTVPRRTVDFAGPFVAWLEVGAAFLVQQPGTSSHFVAFQRIYHACLRVNLSANQVEV
jgi:hypothetical protein